MRMTVVASMAAATVFGLACATQVPHNASQAAVNGTWKGFSATGGMALAYGSLVLMALLPILCGSLLSLKHHEQKKAAGEKVDTMTLRDAAAFPLIASGALLILYIIFTVFSKHYIILLVSSYVFIQGALALSRVCVPIISGLLPVSVPFKTRHLQLLIWDDEKKDYLITYCCTSHELVCLLACPLLVVWCLIKKHWLVNNLLGLAFAVTRVELLYISDVRTGVLLLIGLLVYDIFWVFYTDVMITVVRSFNVPIRLVFPQDLLQKGLKAANFAMLGMGDIVVPGIFIALLLRFDHSLKRGTNTYFKVTLAAYFAGLLMAIFMSHVFRRAQPAMLYLVPACLSAPMLLALVRGDFKALLQYEDYPSLEEGEGKEAVEEKAGRKDK